MVTSAPLALTDEQRAAVEAPDGPHVLAAPPGSGKTEVLVRRVIWLLERSPGQVFRVLALTYTTKAADELQTRVQQALGDEAWRVTASTFHAFCLDMLTHYGEAVGVPANVTVYDDELRGYAFLNALRDAGLIPGDAEPAPAPAAIRACLASIDRLRVDLTPPDLAPDSDCMPRISLKDAYEAYDRSLEAARALDFSSMLSKAHQLLVDDPWVAYHYQRLHRHVLVDEAHDLNRIQYEILRTLFLDGSRNVFMVADDDQEIFTFTGASSEHVRRFVEEFDATELSLSTNFRCAALIVNAAEQLKGHFTSQRPPKPPMAPGTPAPGWIGAWELEDESDEATAAAGWVQRLLTDGLPSEWLHQGEDPGVAPERVGIVGRTRYAFDHIAAELDTRELPYVLRTEEGGLFDSDFGRTLYFSLRVLANPHDRVSRQRLAAQLHQSAQDGQTARETAASYSPTDQDQATAFLRTVAGDSALPSALVDTLVERADSVENLVAGLADLELEPAGDEASHTDSADLWRRDQQRLMDWWKTYAAVTETDHRSLSGFLRHLARLQRTAPTDPGIRLLTSHRAKGMQFRAVVILGLNEGTFPFYRAVQQGKIEEERRAFYVAVTRAERGLLLTRPRARMTSWGNVRRDSVSRFVGELGLEAEHR